VALASDTGGELGFIDSFEACDTVVAVRPNLVATEELMLHVSSYDNPPCPLSTGR
jgi:hypothetical protein